MYYPEYYRFDKGKKEKRMKQVLKKFNHSGRDALFWANTIVK